MTDLPKTEWRCLCCHDRVVLHDGCPKPECVAEREAAERRMGFSRDNARRVNDELWAREILRSQGLVS